MKPAIVGDTTPIPSDTDPHLPPAPLTVNECASSVTYRGIPIAKVSLTPDSQTLYHATPDPKPPAWPATGSATITVEGAPMHRLGDVRFSGEETVIIDWQTPDSYGEISRADINVF